ncbi:ethyl tert-butyl ether degradation EthD (plasmid) [Scytonema sp. HK-05]|uniref:EthD domain-containing protein n=1 Tax=Scytonema sp. HK-05 TaxID=1137095 RepID=UPI000936D08D|nr:EthD domain-containing protein [Scytonema sp. HK-05]OKH59409.1 ethyl tert-butyl ether degradation protein EthD [Scytonema sp. HK-05]BAY50077.1 ethyl tert-butyl ether degradation EthD [Scytonema sp. HK-05]
MAKVDYSTRDQDVKIVLYILIKKRKEIDLHTFDSYWKNVHGPVSARLPGQYQYWQYHVTHNRDGIWPSIDGIEYETPEEDQFDGIAELTFLSEDDCQTWINAAAILDSDQQNFVSKAVIYVTNNGNSKTYVDTIQNGAPIGNLDVRKFHVMVRKTDTITVNDFRKYMVDRFAQFFVKSDLVLKFKLHLLEAHDNSLPPAPGVSHYEPLEKQYQAAFEIAFKNWIDMEKFFDSQAYAAVVKDQKKYIKHFATFPERGTYTFVYNSELTLAGQRTSTVAELITSLGATNQTQDKILNLMFDNVA